MKIFSRLTVLPRGFVILIDQVLVFVSVSLAFLLRFNFNIGDVERYNPFPGIVIYMASALVATLITKSYAGIVRYTGIQDGIRIVQTEFLGLFIVIISNLIYYYNAGHNLIPYSVIFISFFISSLLLYQYRLLVKNIFMLLKSDGAVKTPVLIFGAGAAGFLTKQAIQSDMTNQYKLVGFIDDDVKKDGKDIGGTRIYSTEKTGLAFKEI